ncbi:hypothetical protein TNCV_937721 [Trichonephila clavipes]|nr:hypothetical protein TNCV_937721 [Trichonephila clavipes]
MNRVIFTSPYKICTRAIGNGPWHFEPWSNDNDNTELAYPSPNFHSTPTGCLGSLEGKASKIENSSLIFLVLLHIPSNDSRHTAVNRLLCGNNHHICRDTCATLNYSELPPCIAPATFYITRDPFSRRLAGCNWKIKRPASDP